MRFLKKYFLEQQQHQRDIKLRFDKTGVNSDSHKNIQACIQSYVQFLEKVDKIFEESSQELGEKLKNVREVKEKIVSKQFLPEKLEHIKEEGNLICSNSGMALHQSLL